jgi:hypothetical protein
MANPASLSGTDTAYQGSNDQGNTAIGMPAITKQAPVGSDYR